MLLYVAGWMLTVFGALMFAGSIYLFLKPAPEGQSVLGYTFGNVVFMVVMACLPLGFGLACLLVASGKV